MLFFMQAIEIIIISRVKTTKRLKLEVNLIFSIFKALVVDVSGNQVDENL